MNSNGHLNVWVILSPFGPIPMARIASFFGNPSMSCCTNSALLFLPEVGLHQITFCLRW